jgi:hypothetical protein
VNEIRCISSENIPCQFLNLAALDIKKFFDCVTHIVTEFTQKFNSTLLVASFMKKIIYQTGLKPWRLMVFLSMILLNCSLFANDCLIMTSGNGPNLSINNIEYSLALAFDWYNCNKLILNASKTDVMTVSNKFSLSKCLGQVIQAVRQIKIFRSNFR